MTEFDPFGRQAFYDGDYRHCEGEILEVINPATEALEGEIAAGDAETVATVVDRANAAQRQWAARPATERAALLHDVADSIESADIEPIAEQLTREHGKPYPEATGEVANVASIFRYYAELARDEAGVQPGTTQSKSFQFARTFPYGVSVHIVPSNFPILIMSWTVAASIAAGNAAIVKPSEATSLSTLRFMRRFSALPDGVVSCVTGGVDTAQALIRSSGTDVAAFTGGVAGAKAVNAACAEQMMPAVIEAGGNDPMIVSEAAPMEVAIAGSTTAAFHLSGQVCTSSERFYVHEAVHGEFVDGLVEMAEALRVGDGLENSEIGPLVSETAREEVSRLVDSAVESGATVACGGRVPPDRERGWFYEPTVLTDVTPEMEIMREETFGPVAPVCRVSSFEEALTLSNRSELGLGASVFTTDLREAMAAYETLEAGMVWINNPMIDNEAIPFGGWKQSGVGRELGRAGLEEFRQTKMGVIDWDPQVREWWYPYPDEWFHGTDGSRF